jgi:hypothetical protein
MLSLSNDLINLRILNMGFVRYHLKLKKGRTTVSLDKTLSDLIAIRLGCEIGTKEAHVAVREKLEFFIADDPTRSGYGLASFMSNRAILFLVNEKLCTKYWGEIAKEFEDEKKVSLG